MDSDMSRDDATLDSAAGDAMMAALILLLGWFLTATGSGLALRWQQSPTREAAASYEDLLGIAATIAGLLVLSWWMVSVLGAITAAALERCGRTRAAAAAGKLSPAFMRRLALAVLGIQLATAPLANASTPSGLPAEAVPIRVAAAAAWTPAAGLVSSDSQQQFPARPAAAAPARAPSPDPSIPLPSAPGKERSGGSAALDARWKPPVPAAEPGSLTAPLLRADEPTAAPPVVTVRSGDTLWGLAAASLGPFASDVEIAMAWPRLYQSNQAVIGDDPHLLLPGQVLRLPPRP